MQSTGKKVLILIMLYMSAMITSTLFHHCLLSTAIDLVLKTDKINLQASIRFLLTPAHELIVLRLL